MKTLIAICLFLISDLASARTIQVRSIPAPMFCQAISSSLKGNLSAKLGPIALQQVTTDLVESMRLGQFAEYMPVTDFDTTSNSQAYLSTLSLIGSSLGLKSPDGALLARAADELKYLPYMQNGTELVLITDSSSPLNATRAKAVAATAVRKKVRITVVWAGPDQRNPKADSLLERFPDRQAAGLAYITAMTGGRFVHIGGPLNPCLTQG